MQKLGQHFLKNDTALEKIVNAIAVTDGDRIIEIGPGHGELTVPLLHAAKGMHCDIFCIEKDHALVGKLELLAGQENIAREKGGGAGSGHVTIVEGDALRLLSGLAAPKSAPAKTSPYKIVGNIPYYITGKLLRAISELPEKPERTVLLIQKEVAERICAAPPEMNRLAASVQFWANPAIVALVPREDFSPPPDVDSAIIVLKNKYPPLRSGAYRPNGGPPIDPKRYYKAVRAIFAQPRRTLLNNLSMAMQETSAKNDIGTIIKSCGIDPAVRPQNLSIDQIIALAIAVPWG